MPGFLIPRRKGRQRKETGRSLDFPAGAKLFDAGHPPKRIYLLRSGRVQLSSGGNVIVDYLSPGNFFGEKCLLGSRWGGQIAATLSPVRVGAFRKSELLEFVQRDRRFALRLLKNLALRLDRHEQALRHFVAESGERRLAWLLSSLAPARPASGWVRLRFSPSNPELAKTIGSTRWRVSHFMGRFQQLGWLRRRPELWIHRESLQEFLERSGTSDHADAASGKS